MNDKFLKPYNSKDVEESIYKLWEESGYFNPDNLPDERNETYTITLPPPNVTGTLHLGHAYEDSLQDTVIRYQRMKGKRALWVPGTDSAAIATQAKVEKKIQKEEDQIRNTVSPVFNIDPNVEIGVQTKIDSLYRNIQPVIEGYYNWQESKQQSLSSVFDDSIRFAQEYANAEIQLTEGSWTVLFDSYYSALSNNLSVNSFIGVQVKQQLESVVETLMNDGIINRTKASIEQIMAR